MDEVVSWSSATPATQSKLTVRGITEAMLDACYDGIVDGRRLRVVDAEEHAAPILVTAHWIEGEDD